jgi:hypothetical protein
MRRVIRINLLRIIGISIYLRRWGSGGPWCRRGLHGIDVLRVVMVVEVQLVGIEECRGRR